MTADDRAPTVRIDREGRVRPLSPAEARLHQATAATAAERQAVRPEAAPPDGRPPRFDIARVNDNELILFDPERRESWIVYPPRSGYEFLHRPRPDAVLVEHHPWAPYAEAVVHPVLTSDGCLEHGLACRASLAIEARVRLGWDPFR